MAQIGRAHGKKPASRRGSGSGSRTNPREPSATKKRSRARLFHTSHTRALPPARSSPSCDFSSPSETCAKDTAAAAFSPNAATNSSRVSSSMKATHHTRSQVGERDMAKRFHATYSVGTSSSTMAPPSITGA